MACKSCKEKSNIKDDIKDTGSFVPKGVIIFAIIWTCFGIYGVYSLIHKFL
jgi:hypothetical protein